MCDKGLICPDGPRAESRARGITLCGASCSWGLLGGRGGAGVEQKPGHGGGGGEASWSSVCRLSQEIDVEAEG